VEPPYARAPSPGALYILPSAKEATVSDPIVTWYEELSKIQGISESNLLLTAAQRLSLVYQHAADIESCFAEAGAQVDAPLKAALQHIVDNLLQVIKAEGECTRQLLITEMRGGSPL
jgi:hypothetical protein